MSYTVKEAAEVAGLSEKVFRMHIVREKVRVTRSGNGKVTITEDDLQAYMLTEGLIKNAADVQGQTSHAIYSRLNATLAPLPQALKDAILQGMPKMGRGGMTSGDPGPFRKAMGLPKVKVSKPDTKLLTSGADDDEVEEGDF